MVALIGLKGYVTQVEVFHYVLSGTYLMAVSFGEALSFLAGLYFRCDTGKRIVILKRALISWKVPLIQISNTGNTHPVFFSITPISSESLRHVVTTGRFYVIPHCKPSGFIHYLNFNSWRNVYSYWHYQPGVLSCKRKQLNLIPLSALMDFQAQPILASL